MDRIRLFGLLALMNIFISKSVVRGDHSFIFETRDGPSWEILESLQGSRSYTECALVCVEKRFAGMLPCMAFSFYRSDRSCDFFKLGAQNAPRPDSPVFWFKARGQFHTVDVGGHLFTIYLSTVGKTFFDARTHCNDLGGYLLEIRLHEVYDAIKIVAQGETGGSYVGANDIAVENQWVHDSDNTPIDPAIWRWFGQEGYTYRLDENCPIIAFSDWMNADIACTIKASFLCQKDI